MRMSNRCPKCGGVASHFITDTGGRNYYRCRTGLTTLTMEERKVSSQIVPCEAIIDRLGKVFTGRVAYMTGGGVTTFSAQ